MGTDVGESVTSATPGGPGCERAAEGMLGEPVSALTSLAFVLAAVVVLVSRDRRTAARGTGATSAPSRRPLAYAALVAGVGLGSFVQHGPDPVWSDVAHDLPLVGLLAMVGADAWGGLTGSRRRWWWWALPTVAVLGVVVGAPRAGDLAQVGLAVVAVALSAARAQAVPTVRRRTVLALGLLAVGGVVGTLSRAGGPWCEPGSVWQGHGAWHVLAAAALVVLAPTLGAGTATPGGWRRRLR